VVTVQESGRIIGVLYAKERKYLGMRLGVVYADATLGAMMVAEQGRRSEILEVAIRTLWDSYNIRSLRMLVVPGSFEDAVITERIPLHAADVRYSKVENHCVLELPSTYDGFLQMMGKQTRRNFRYYRRRSQHSGQTYVASMSFADFKQIAFRLLAKGVVGADRSGLNRALSMISSSERPIMIGLRNQHGGLISILGGWYEYDRAVVFCQMNNDKDYRDSSLCTVLRGYFFESLIAEGVTKVLFWAGIGEPLRHHCNFLPTTAACFDKRSLHWRLVRSLVARSSWLLPSRLQTLSKWIAH
jgi:hypothetical protein